MIKEYALVPTGPTRIIDTQRVRAGATKYFEDISRGILISGIWNGDPPENYYGSQSERMCIYAKNFRVPDESIFFENKSRNTLENVFYSTKFFVENGSESTIICTDKEHGKRFEMLFGVAKDDRILPRDFNVEIFSEGIDNSYPYWKSQAAYFKDYIKTFNGIKVK